MARNLISKDRRTRILLLTAQGLALAALVLGLIFLVNTTGGRCSCFPPSLRFSWGWDRPGGRRGHQPLPQHPPPVRD